MKIFLKSIPLFLILICSAQAEMTMMPMPPPLKPINPSRAFPLAPASSWKDGFFLVHPDISEADFGFHARLNLMYNREPFGVEDGQDVLRNRFTGQASVLFSVKELVELGVSFPFSLYQSADQADQTQLPSLARGDVHLLLKGRIPLPKKWPQFGILADLAFDTSSDGSYLGGGKVNGTAVSGGSFRVLGRTPKWEYNGWGSKGYFLVAANFGGFFSGNQPICDAMNMPDGCANGKGLGSHFVYGFGPTLALPTSYPWKTLLAMEFNGSFSGGLESRTPFQLSVGLEAIHEDKAFLSASYSHGFTQGSPNHTAIIGFGWIFGYTKEPPKAPEKPKSDAIPIDLCQDPNTGVVGICPDKKDLLVGKDGKPIGPGAPLQRKTIAIPVPPGFKAAP